MKDYVEANRAAYDLVAEEYLARAGSSAEPLDQLVGKPLGYAQQSFERITALEIGPGSGEVCAYLAERDCDTVAIDVSPKILENVRQLSPTTQLIEADILSYVLEPSSFELIYCGALIHLFTLGDAQLVMSGIANALKKDGVLFINTTIHQQSDEGFYEKNDYADKVKRFRHRYTLSEFTNLIDTSGLSIIDQLTTAEDDRDKYWLAYICRK